MSEYKCSKCHKDISDYSIFSEGGVVYMFCTACTENARSLNPGQIKDYCGPKAETWIDKNMREARKRRAAGISLW